MNRRRPTGAGRGRSKPSPTRDGDAGVPGERLRSRESGPEAAKTGRRPRRPGKEGQRVKFFHGVLRLLALAIMALAMPALAMADVTITAPGQSTSGTYMDYMKTVYQRAGAPELIMLPLTAFDNNYQLQPMGAKSWEQSKDGLTWTFHLQDNLLWSDGTPLTAEDYVFALQRAAKEGYDFNWY